MDNKLEGLIKKTLGKLAFPAFRLILLLIFWGVFCGSAMADYKRSVLVSGFQSPPDWAGNYNPGTVAARALWLEAQKSAHFLPQTEGFESDSKKDQKAMELEEDDSRKSKKILPHPSHYRLEGELTRVIQNVRVYEGPHDVAGVPSDVAEIHLKFRLIHNLTERVMGEEEVWAVGEGPISRYPTTADSLIPGTGAYQSTSMGNAFEMLSRKALNRLNQWLTHLPLDAQVLFVDEVQETVTLNVGLKNGVHIQDEFIIYKLNRNVMDPITEVDLGDNFERLGVIRVLRLGEGFAIGKIMAGEGFARGHIARVRLGPDSGIEPVGEDPWFERMKETKTYRPGGSGLHQAPSSVLGVDFLNVLGFSLSY